MRSTTLRHGALAAAVALVLALSACGDDEDGASTGDDLSGTLNGAGASSQQAAMQAWIAAFGDDNPDVTINYDPVGSGGGRTQFLGGDVQFAGSDAYLKAEELTTSQERCAGTTALDLPVYVSPIAVVYNLPGVDELKLNADTIAKIFDQKIKTWNDPAIVATNPGVQFPSTAITPVNRSDESGTTLNFTDYLSKASASWSHDPAQEWPVAGGEGAQGTSGVIQAVTAGEGAIGYADASQAGDLGVVQVQVGSEFVGPSPEAAAAALDAATSVAGRPEGDLAFDLARDTTASGAYPIILISYLIICQEYEEQNEADLIKAFVGYVASQDGQNAAATAAGSAPISADLRSAIADALDSVTAG